MTMRPLWDKLLNRRAFFRGSAILASTTLLSYGLGLLRDRLLAHGFGASRVLGAYEAAFIVPDLILNIFVAGALSAAFIPIFNSLSKTDDGASDFTSSVINGSLVMVLTVGIIVFFFSPWLANLIVPGFDGQSKQIFINLLRLLLLSPIIFAVSNTIGNLLLASESFFWYGISASLYNLGTILGTIFLAPTLGIYGVALGTLGGALLHLLARLGGLAKNYFHYRLKIRFNDNYRRFLGLMGPKMIQQPLEELTFLGFTVIASTLTAGAIVVLNFARNFQVMPVNTIGVTFALAIFPAISRLAAARERRQFTNEIIFTAKSILIVTIPAAAVIYFFRLPIISIIFGGGAFDRQAIELTASTLGIFTLSIPTESLSHLLARGFYALKDSLTPVLVSLISLVVAVAGGYIFSSTLGVKGLALGFVLGSSLKTVGLMILLTKKTRSLQNQ